MRLDINEISHNYITRLIIFSIFLFKNYRKDDQEYARMVSDYIRKKTRLKIIVDIECGPKYSIEDRREKSITQLLLDEKIQILNLVVVRYKTNFKEVNLQIDLNNEEKYESYIYS